MQRASEMERRITGCDRLARDGPTLLFDEVRQPLIRVFGDRDVTGHAHSMRTGSEDHRPHLLGYIDEREPHRHCEIGVERPVIPILMPGSTPRACRFEEGLIVIDPYRRNAEELGGSGGETAVENDSTGL